MMAQPLQGVKTEVPAPVFDGFYVKGVPLTIPVQNQLIHINIELRNGDKSE